MIPHDFTACFAQARQAELRAAAGRPARPGRTATARQRVGWFLVHAGLRLVAGRREPVSLPA